VIASLMFQVPLLVARRESGTQQITIHESGVEILDEVEVVDQKHLEMFKETQLMEQKHLEVFRQVFDVDEGPEADAAVAAEPAMAAVAAVKVDEGVEADAAVAAEAVTAAVKVALEAAQC